MRVVPSLLIVCGLAVALSRLDAQPEPDAAAVMAAARKALGGEKRLSAVKRFSLTGRTRQVHDKNLVPIEFELLCEPDRCARTDERPAPEETARKARVTSVQQDDVRLTLGMFAGSFSGSPLVQLCGSGRHAAGQGRRDRRARS